MSRLLRVAALIVLATVLDAARVHAAPINVATFSWDLNVLDPGIECPADDPVCVPADPFVVSFFSLTNIWDGPGTITLFDSSLILPTETRIFDDPFSQEPVIGVPAFGSTQVSFVFAGETITLGTALSSPDSLAVLTFDPTTVPEPGTLGLLALGTGLFTLRRRQRRP